MKIIESKQRECQECDNEATNRVVFVHSAVDLCADCLNKLLSIRSDSRIAAAVQAERERCEWHIQNAMKFYAERIAWCDNHPGNDTAKTTSQYALDSHTGVLAAIRAVK